jgi:hypothetical protein
MSARQFCTACGQRLPPPARLEVGGYERQAIVDLLARLPQGLTRKELIAELYGEDGCKNRNVISVLVTNANRELREQGWVITDARQHPHRYTLQRLEIPEGVE